MIGRNITSQPTLNSPASVESASSSGHVDEHCVEFRDIEKFF